MLVRASLDDLVNTKRYLYLTVVSKQLFFLNFGEKKLRTHALQATGTLRSCKDLRTLAHEHEELSRSCTLRVVEVESVILEEGWKARAITFDVCTQKNA